MRKFLYILLLLFLVQISAGIAVAENTKKKKTDSGKFFVEISAQNNDLKVGDNSIDMTVQDENGKSVEGATVTVVPWMPEMGHGGFKETVVLEKGRGLYNVNNIALVMAGNWELRINIKKDNVEDRVVFDFPDVRGASEMQTEQAHDHHAGALVPIGVMGGHMHHEGKWMTSYRYMYMDMDGNRDGTNRVDTSSVLADYMVSPLAMTMQMHMLGIMYAPNDNLSIMSMLPYLKKEMAHITRTGVNFTTKTDGIGDVSLSVLYKFYNEGVHNFHLNAGVSFPTGSIDEKGDTPAGSNVQLPYPMQLGSGTFDLMPGVTYLGSSGDVSWGSQFSTVIRLGENSNDYALGDKFSLTGWLSRKWGERFDTTLRIDGQLWGDIEGADPSLAGPTVPTADPGLRGGKRVDLLFGLGMTAPEKSLRDGRLAIEAGAPLYQDLDGPQLETDWLLTVGVQWSF